ncbi:MAG: Gfo/Idh/MocA family oxidoreductase [Elusimicrobia bacterium]|nr:Gfo/Idh/MocA family oxidoreductase [Elusimicrobiota bacterium]
MPDDKLRAGVVGVGHLGRHHARVYSELENARLAAVADTDVKQGKKIAEKFGAEFFEDYRRMIGRVDAVSVVTPTETHFSIAKDFLSERVNTLVEKPITNEPGPAQELIDISDRTGAVLQVGHIERYNAAVKKAREYIKDPRFIEVNRLSRFPARSLDIGVVLDLMIHDIDIILSFVASPVQKIDAIGASVFSKNEDIANCRIMFANGCVANITASRISYKSERKFRVFESDTYLSLDYEKQDFTVYRKKAPRIQSPGDVERIAPSIEKTEPLKEELKDFVRCVKEKTAPTVSGRHGLSALKLALDIAGRI